MLHFLSIHDHGFAIEASLGIDRLIFSDGRILSGLWVLCHCFPSDMDGLLLWKLLTIWYAIRKTLR